MRGAACLAWLVIVGVVWGCAAVEPAPPFDLTGVFPVSGAVVAWEPESDIATYDADTLYDLVDGQADAFYAYNFRAVAVRDYRHSSNVLARVEVWELATSEDAYGLFSISLSGAPVALGNGGDADPGRRVVFWQDRFLVQVRAREPVPMDDLLSLGRALASALPQGGTVPDIVQRLPDAGLEPGAPVFFRQELSIQDWIWLGGANVLGLSSETEGALGRYDLGDTPAYLMLVRYPQAEAAAAGKAGLLAAEVAGLVSVDLRGQMLVAVFGELEVERAQTLLGQVLETLPAE